MTQTRRDPAFRAEFGRRFGQLVAGHLRMSLTALATRLGYETDSVLRKVEKGEAHLSVEKLRQLAALPLVGTDARVSIDWLLTGVGSPLRIGTGSPPVDSIAARIERAPEGAQLAIRHFLDVQEGRRLGPEEVLGSSGASSPDDEH